MGYFWKHINLLNSRKSTLDEVGNATALFPENKPEEEYNQKKIDKINHHIIFITSIDQIAQDAPDQTLNCLTGLPQTTTGRLSAKLSVKKGPRIMLMSNVNLRDRSINGKISILYDFAF